jgi:hypothetical protein
VRRDGALVQVDRGGHPTINPFINPEYAKDEYNAGHPVDDVAKYLEPWSQILRQNGYPAAEAAAARHRSPGHPAVRPQPAGRLSQRAHAHR